MRNWHMEAKYNYGQQLVDKTASGNTVWQLSHLWQ